MALIKGFNVINNLKGKIGNIVVQKGVYGESVVRAYTSEVKNPKTIAQANQRMKAAPTQYARRAMKEIIDHSFEGIAYGQKSLNHFVSLAMKGNAAPAQQKGDMRFIPGKYQMSSGSLNPITSVSDGAGFITNLKLTATLGSDSQNVGFMSTSLLNDNDWLQEGDNLTFCYVTVSGDNNYYLFKYKKIRLDPTDTTPFNGFSIDVTTDEFARFVAPNAVAFACIISRQSGTNWMRSSATMAVSADIEEQYFSPTAIETAIASYTAVAKATFSDWYMNQGEVNILRFGTAKVSSVSSAYADTEQANIEIPTAIIVEDGQQKVAVFESGDGIVGLDGKKITYDDQQGGEGVIDPRALDPGYVVLEWSDDYLGKF